MQYLLLERNCWFWPELIWKTAIKTAILCKTCSYSEFFWLAFSCIRDEFRRFTRKSLNTFHAMQGYSFRRISSCKVKFVKTLNAWLFISQFQSLEVNAAYTYRLRELTLSPFTYQIYFLTFCALHATNVSLPDGTCRFPGFTIHCGVTVMRKSKSFSKKLALWYFLTWYWSSSRLIHLKLVPKHIKTR